MAPRTIGERSRARFAVIGNGFQIWIPLRLLHSTQAVTRLLIDVAPPSTTGTTWSISNGTPNTPQYRQQ